MSENNYGTYPNQQQPPSYSSTHSGGAYENYAQVYGQELPQYMEKPAVPGTIKMAANSIYAIVLLNIVSTVLGLVYWKELLQSSMDGVMGMFGSVIPEEDRATLEAELANAPTELSTFELVTSLGGTVLFSAALIILAIFLVKGHNWARIVLTVYAAFKVLGLLGIFSFFLFFHWTMLVDLLAGVLAIVFLVFVWKNPVSTYMRQIKAYQQWKLQQAYLGADRGQR